VISHPLRRVAHGLIATAVLAGVASAQTPTKPPPPPPDHQHMPGMSMPGMDMGMPPVDIPKGAIFTEADVRFMQGMIAHHAQAIYMSRLAAGRQANARVLKFANKIDQSQVAEIHLMQDWLRANKQFVPDTSSWRTMHMPGMLTDAQLAQLDAAKGVDFDRAFLNLMIQHHTGALKMVTDLFATPLAGQDVDVSVFANDVQTVQTAEIDIMHQMLDAL
jgi:uncharacterized protein (DUF305 family)